VARHTCVDTPCIQNQPSGICLKRYTTYASAYKNPKACAHYETQSPILGAACLISSWSCSYSGVVETALTSSGKRNRSPCARVVSILAAFTPLRPCLNLLPLILLGTCQKLGRNMILTVTGRPVMQKISDTRFVIRLISFPPGTSPRRGKSPGRSWRSPSSRQ
jgi:hypothetical protein